MVFFFFIVLVLFALLIVWSWYGIAAALVLGAILTIAFLAWLWKYDVYESHPDRWFMNTLWVVWVFVNIIALFMWARQADTVPRSASVPELLWETGTLQMTFWWALIVAVIYGIFVWILQDVSYAVWKGFWALLVAFNLITAPFGIHVPEHVHRPILPTVRHNQTRFVCDPATMYLDGTRCRPLPKPAPPILIAPPGDFFICGDDMRQEGNRCIPIQ